MRQMQLETLDASSGVGSPSDATLAESMRRLRQVTEGSVDQLVLVDRQLRVQFVNRPVGGLTPEQMHGHHVEKLIPHRSRDRAVACLQGVLAHGIPDRFEVEWQTPKGGVRYLEVRVAPVLEAGHVVALTLNGSDTTEHVLAQRAVATQAKMIESMIEGVALIDSAGRILITNPAFDQLFAYTRGMLIGQPAQSLGGGAPLEGAIESALAGREGPWAFEFDARRSDGGSVTVAGALSRLEDGGRQHLMLVLQDVSERKKLEGAVLEAVNREHYRIGNDLHDGLGQELTGIALMLRCLAGRLANEHRDAVPDVENITRLVSNAVESTRSLARGLSPVNLERGGLRDALEGLAMHARTVYGVKAVFSNRLPPTIALDAEASNHLYRIAQEAVTNAVKHGKANAVRLHLSVSQGKLRMAVVDDGCGVPDDVASATGMGLRIMRYRARIARGDVRVERADPSGTRVVFEGALSTRATSPDAASNLHISNVREAGRASARPAMRSAAKRASDGAAKLVSAPLKTRRRARGEQQ